MHVQVSVLTISIQCTSVLFFMGSPCAFKQVFSTFVNMFRHFWDGQNCVRNLRYSEAFRDLSWEENMAAVMFTPAVQLVPLMYFSIVCRHFRGITIGGVVGRGECVRVPLTIISFPSSDASFLGSLCAATYSSTSDSGEMLGSLIALYNCLDASNWFFFNAAVFLARKIITITVKIRIFNSMPLPRMLPRKKQIAFIPTFKPYTFAQHHRYIIKRVLRITHYCKGKKHHVVCG